MNIIKGIAVFVFLTVLFGSCFDPPEFPITPSISLNSISFQAGRVANDDADTLFLVLNFKDGDGDLGLPESLLDSPYHATNYFLENNGELTPVSTGEYLINYPPVVLGSILEVPASAEGKLVTKRTRAQTGDTRFPPYIDPFTCSAYTRDSIYVKASDSRIFDGSYNIHRVLPTTGVPELYILRDTFYYETNPMYYNIDVQFLIKQGGDFVEVNWPEEFCFNGNGGFPGFNGRFPVLADQENPLEGILKYKITSVLLYNFFTVRTLKLRITVRDRAMHESNVIETEEFTLDKIRR